MARKLPCSLHRLYEASVQYVESDLDFIQRVYRRKNGRLPYRLREDFCGTALLACEWVKRSTKNSAVGVDLHAPTIRWAKQCNVDRLTGSQKERISLVEGDVLEVEVPGVDVVLGLNFSFCVFKTRALLKRYFVSALNGLNAGGMLVLDIYGGGDSVVAKEDDSRLIPGFMTPEGEQVPEFEYRWEQCSFDAVSHSTRCAIHFDVPGFGVVDHAYTYDWRLWTLPEIQELLLEAGFKTASVYLHGFTDEGESDGVFRRRVRYENEAAWIAYVVGERGA